MQANSYEDMDPITAAEDMQRESAEDDYDDQPMDETELQSIVASEIEDAISYIDSDLSPFRAQATRYYRGDPFGNEAEGSSQAISTEVRDVVNAMLPSIMRTMFSSERAVSLCQRVQRTWPWRAGNDYANYVCKVTTTVSWSCTRRLRTR